MQAELIQSLEADLKIMAVLLRSQEHDGAASSGLSG